MKIHDQIIVAFLVSAGVFSSIQATQYVRTLSAKEKQSLHQVATVPSEKPLTVCDASGADAIVKNPHKNNA